MLCQALDVAVTQEVVAGMITEVSILCGHDDDSKLSFRDYMNCLKYEKSKDEHNKVAEEALEAAEECLERGITNPQARAPRDPHAAPPPAMLRLLSHSLPPSLLRAHTLTRTPAPELNSPPYPHHHLATPRAVCTAPAPDRPVHARSAWRMTVARPPLTRSPRR